MSDPVKFVSLDGQRVAYRDAGSGPALLLLHGIGGNSATWEPQFARFAGSHRVVAWDMPGFGDSEPFSSAPTMRTYSSLAARLMDALGVDRAVGIGTSYGTVILADLAHTHPSRISAMVFACGVTGMGHLPAETRAQLRATRRAEIESLGQRKFAETRNSTYLGRGMPREMVERIVELAASATPEGYLAAYNALTESDIFPSLAGLDIPALVVSGNDDPIAPASDCARVAAALRQADYHAVANAGHYVNLEQAGIFNRLVDEFLTRIGRTVKA